MFGSAWTTWVSVGTVEADAPAEVLAEKYGFTPEAVAAKVLAGL